MTPDTDLLPDDDSFVRTAIQGLRVPGHGPDFWDRLAGQLDDAADDLVSQGLMEEVLRSALLPDLAGPEPRPHHVEDPWPEPGVDEPFAEDPPADPYGPVDEPVYEDEYEEERADEAAAYEPAYDEPGPAQRSDPDRFPDRTAVWSPDAASPSADLRHDRAVVPASLRRPSTVVLLVVAFLAAALAVAAGLKLVHQRSGSAPAVSSNQAAAPLEPGEPVVLERIA